MAPPNGAALIFDGFWDKTNTNDYLSEIGLLTLSTPGWDITANTLTLNAGITANGTSTVDGTFTLGAAQTFQNSTGTLTVSGTVANGGYLLTVDGLGDTLLSAAVSGTGGLTKSGSGILTFTANNTHSGATIVNGGTVIIGTSGNLSGTSGVNIASGATLTWNSTSSLNAALVSVSSGGRLNGTGSLTGNLTVNGKLSGTTTLAGTVGGSGAIDPGNSPGILTVGQVDPTGGLDFNFEFTATGSPNYGNAGASINDVLRVTDGTTPFSASLGGSNLVDIYLNVTGLEIGNQFRGGWYTDQGSDFLSSISGGAHTFYVFGDGGGAHTYNSVNYYTLEDYNTATSSDFIVNIGTVESVADFGSGSINGHVTQFTVVPEPGTLALLTLGSLAVLWRWKQKKLQKRSVNNC